MRTKTSRADEILEPVAVYEDGECFEPEFASPEARGSDAWTLVRECVEVAREVLDESIEVRTQAPWTSVERLELPTVPSGRFLATFSRMIFLHPSRLRGLPEWWHQRARTGHVYVARRLALEEPRRSAHGSWRMHGRLASPWFVRSIPIELLLWPHLGEWTKLSLEPQCRVHCGRRYFRNGHAVLDALTDRLVVDLDP
jgi:hypothetical protein